MGKILGTYAILFSLTATGVLAGMLAVAVVDHASCAGGCSIASISPALTLSSADKTDCGNCD